MLVGEGAPHRRTASRTNGTDSSGSASQPSDVSRDSIGSVDDRADALDQVDVDPHRHREDDVREHHRGVDAVRLDRSNVTWAHSSGCRQTSKSEKRSLTSGQPGACGPPGA